MNIALVSPYDFAYPGGVGNHISALAHQLAKMNHEVKVIAPASKAVSTSGYSFVPMGKPLPFPSSGSIARVTLSPWLSSKVKTLLARERFDIIHLHEPLCPTLCTTILSLSRTANIGTFHAVDSRSYSLFKPLTTLFLRKLFHKLDGKIAVSQAAREFTNRYFPADYTIIPNGVDLENFSPDVSPIDEFSDGKINVLFVGRLEKRKGLDYLLEAYKQVKREVSNSRLILVGPGTRWSDHYEKQVRRAGMTDVAFIGYVSYGELPRYYQTADIVCSPAINRESFGIVLLEAMAVGKPVVASNLKGYAGVLTHGVDGLLVPPRNGQKLAQALISLIADGRLRKAMGMKGRIKALDYGWHHIAQMVMEYYTTVLNERNR